LHHRQFENCRISTFHHRHLLEQAQTLRARVYLKDGAIEKRRLTRDGRLVHLHDEHSWHLLIISGSGKVAGCARYSPQKYHVPFSSLGLAGSALAMCPSWGRHLRVAVESKRAEARRRGISYVELGGWALDERIRNSSEVLRILLHAYGLAKHLGGALAVTTATIRHRSSSILRKLGAFGLSVGGIELPAYYDPQHECEMEILGFDSDHPNPKYRDRIEECRNRIRSLMVVSA